MSLLINIIEFPENCTVAESSKTFGEQGGTIGRSADNYWVLSDPDCYLSSNHSEITFENGGYVLTDLSTNGTFLNGSREPMGKGNKIQLQDGDEVELSDYKLKIKLLNAVENHPTYDDPFNSMDVASEAVPQTDFMSSDPFATNEIASVEPLLNSEPQVVDPLEALNSKVQINEASNFSSDVFTPQQTQSDQSGIINQSISWPQSNLESGATAGAIPEDWDLNEEDDLAVLDDVNVQAPIQNPVQVPAQTAGHTMVDAGTIQNLQAENLKLMKDIAALQTHKNENEHLKNELKKIKQQFIAYQKKNTAAPNTPSNVDTTFITALGIPSANLTRTQILYINQIAGEMLRETVASMMQVLTSRSSIKNEFRMNVTTIQPVENNPLKFSANVDDALENMFLKSGSSYKKPVEAILDGFHGIADHQIAILAGIRAAFKGAIDRFEPGKLEQRFDKQKSTSLDFIPLLKKAKNWNQFVQYYRDLTDDMDNSFQYLFGDEFVQAYEDQLQKLLVARKTN